MRWPSAVTISRGCLDSLNEVATRWHAGKEPVGAESGLFTLPAKRGRPPSPCQGSIQNS